MFPISFLYSNDANWVLPSRCLQIYNNILAEITYQIINIVTNEEYNSLIPGTCLIMFAKYKSCSVMQLESINGVFTVVVDINGQVVVVDISGQVVVFDINGQVVVVDISGQVVVVDINGQVVVVDTNGQVVVVDTNGQVVVVDINGQVFTHCC